jgi:uncharacterized protein (TIGR00159 family)
MPGWIPIPDWFDLVDILLVAAFGWFAIRFLRGSRVRAEMAGVALLGVIYLVARSLDLQLTVVLLQGFFAVFILVLVIVFQDDLRRVFGQLGTWRTLRGEVVPKKAPIDVLVRTVAHLAETRTGALIVIPGREPIERHVEGGVVLGGRVSEPLLLSIFDTGSPGHDGAVLLRDDTIERFALHLPLSSNQAELGPGGTRHAAALGLSERCDAICIVVSEERGTVSLARNGTLRILPSARDLAFELRSTFTPEPTTTPSRRRRTILEFAVALLGSIALWMILVPGSDTTERKISVPIVLTNLPEDYEVEWIDPPEATVTLSGLQRDLLLLGVEDVEIEIDAYLARFGRRTFALSPDDVRKPNALDVLSVEPDRLKISILDQPEEPAEAEAGEEGTQMEPSAPQTRSDQGARGEDPSE